MTTSMTSKRLVRAALSGGATPRPPFIPWVCSFAAKVEQVTIWDMLNDVALLQRGLDSARKLFTYDAIVVAFDSTLEAEACGCTVDWPNDDALPIVVSHPLADGIQLEDASLDAIGSRGRMPIALEGTKRLILTSGRNVGILGHITGPLTLATHLLGRDIVAALAETPAEAEQALEVAGKVAARMCRLYGELSVDGLVIADALLAKTPSDVIASRIKRAIQPTMNLAKFYNVGSILVAGGELDPSQREAIAGLGATAMVLEAGAQAPSAGKSRMALGAGIPVSALLSGAAELDAALASLVSATPTPAFLTTDWEVPFETPIDNMHKFARACLDLGVAG